MNQVDMEPKGRSVIEDLQEGYYEVNLTGTIIYANQALLDLSGYTREELIGKQYDAVVPPRTARTMKVVFGQVFKSGQNADAAYYEVFHKDGHTLTVEFGVTLILGPNGQPVGFQGIVRDVSQRVKDTEKQNRIEIERQHIRKMEALGTMAGGLAHGFNNVLMAIQGNLSLMQINLPQNDPMQKHLDRISQSTEKGAHLAKQILSFAKKGRFVTMPTNMNKILKSTSSMFVRSKPNLIIHEFYQQDLWVIQGDRVQIGQMLLDLYLNAAQAMPDGGELYLHSENVMLDESETRPYDVKAGNYVKISVTDTGYGLNTESMQRIFEPFYSAHRPARYDGVGLAAVYGIIKSHKGIIHAYSEKGHGTTFTLYLPARDKERSGKTQPPKRSGGNETILVVDDDETTASVARDILEHSDYRVMVAENGAQGISIYKEHGKKIDLILLDMILPDLHGNQAYHELQRIDPNVLVVLTSGYNINRQISALLKQGCAGFVQKPFHANVLAAKIRSALDGKPTQM